MEQKLSENREQTELQLKEAQRQVDEAEFELTAARDSLREAEDQVLRLQGQEKQCEILHGALQEAAASGQRELESIGIRLRTDSERLSAQQAKLEVYRVQLAETDQTLAALEGQESETSRRTTALTESMTAARSSPPGIQHGYPACFLKRLPPRGSWQP